MGNAPNKYPATAAISREVNMEDQPRRGRLSAAGLSRNDSVEVERLDLKTLNVRATARERVGINALHLSVDSFS
jgi:hypothetical protein